MNLQRFEKYFFYANASSNVALTALVLVFLAFGCNSSSDIGAGFFEDESFELASLDTLTLKVSTVLNDSLSTLDSDRLLVGYHEDADFGKVYAASYLQVTLGDTPDLDSTFTIYDSLTLVLQFDGYSFYDTLQWQTLSVHRLTEEIELDEETDDLYNSSRFDYATEPLGIATFKPRPQKKGTLEVRLDDAFGQELLDKILQGDEALNDVSKFQEYLNGFVLLPDSTQSGPVVGFSADAEIRLYYTDNEELPTTQKTISFPATGTNFNHIRSDRSGTLLNVLQSENTALDASQSNDLAFLQGGVGLSVRVEAPYLKTMFETNTEFVISKAELIFYPVLQNGTGQDYLPSSLGLTWVDDENKEIYNQGAANLHVDDEFDRDTYYSLDVTEFVNYQLGLNELNENALLINLPEALSNNSVSRMLIGSAEHPRRMKLKLYSIDIKEN